MKQKLIYRRALCVFIAAAGLQVLILTPLTSAVAAGNDSAGDQSRAGHKGCPYGRAHDGSTNCMSRGEFELTRSREAMLAADPGQYIRNALERCDRLTGDDNKDCIARMDGQGTLSGSVEGGGLFRELVTVVPGVPVTVQPTVSPGK